MKKLILLLLFIPLVSFGQEDLELNSNLSISESKPNYFSIGLKVDHIGTGNYTYTYGRCCGHPFEKNNFVLDLNYLINDKFLVGFEYGNNFRNGMGVDGMYGIRLGYKLNDKFLITGSYGLYHGGERFTYSKLSIAFGKKNLVPEFGALIVDGYEKYALGASLGLTYFFKPNRNKAIKKLTQAKNALDLELITQEEYDKIYIKYFKYTKN